MLRKTQQILKVGRFLMALLFLFLLSWQQPPIEDAAFFVNDIMHGFTNERQITLLKNADNTFIVSLFEEHLKDSSFYHFEKSRQWLARKAGAIDVKDKTELIDKVFTRENYEAAKVQAGSYQWDEKLLHDRLPGLAFADKVINGETATISYPVFSADGKYCLLYYAYHDTMALVIYSRQNGKWQRAKFIPLGIG